MKTDCFAYDKRVGSCRALNCLNCDNCHFYQTVEQRKTRRTATFRRLTRLPENTKAEIVKKYFTNSSYLKFGEE